MKGDNNFNQLGHTVLRTVCNANVSSVLPSPTAPKSLTLTKLQTSTSSYWGWTLPTILPSGVNNEGLLYGAAISPCIKVDFNGSDPWLTFPCAHAAIFLVGAEGDVPGKTTVPFNTPTATETFVSCTWFNTIDPARLPLDGFEVRMKIGVSVISASMIAWAPVV